MTQDTGAEVPFTLDAVARRTAAHVAAHLDLETLADLVAQRLATRCCCHCHEAHGNEAPQVPAGRQHRTSSGSHGFDGFRA